MTRQNQNLSIPPNSALNLIEPASQNYYQKWQIAPINYSETTLLHQLFEAQVERSPAAIAVIAETQSLSYEQINQQANRLAHHLRSLGVEPDTVVGLHVERSPLMVVAMLGILKAGGAYLPLDPEQPAERIASILTEAEVSLVLSLSHLSDRLPPQRRPALCLDLEQATLDQYPSTNPVSEARSDHLAYVIYTSGSTGKPKGVMIPHGGICNQLYWRQSTFPLTASDRVLQNISFSFDPSVWQIFWPLSWGAQLVLPKPGGQRDIAYLVELMAEAKVTILALVPSILRAFLDQKKSAHCTALKHVFCGGEALPTVLLEQFLAAFGQTTQLHNVYGPTEASIDATYWTCQAGDAANIAPIGRAIANAEVYVLDEHRKPIASGESGELYIGGRGLARGYLRQPALTAERFVPHPFSADIQARLYRTGDLVRARPDGNLEFLGRLDTQVKIRGFRIELQEIEAVLGQHPSVAHSVVLARTDSANNAYLAAYVLPNDQQTVTQLCLRQFLQAKLPDYMVPTHFVVLSALPLNANGKIDRQALPEPELSRQTLGIDFVAPQEALELAIAKIWEESLHIQPIGLRDSFFELGGSSLLAASMLTQIEETFGQPISLGAFFQTPTIENLVGHLRGTAAKRTHKSLVSIQPQGSQPPLFCIHNRMGIVVRYYSLIQHLGQDQPIYGLQARGLDGQETPHTRVEDMASAYIQEIRSVQPKGPYFLCGSSFGGLVAYEMASQLVEQGEAVGLLALIDTYCLSQPWFTSPKSLKAIASRAKNKLARTANALYQKTFMASRSPKKLPMTAPKSILITIKDINEKAVKRYKPPTYPGQMILFKATQLPDPTQYITREMDDFLGWRTCVQGELVVHPVPGNHFNLLKEPNARALGQQLQACLVAARTAEEPVGLPPQP